MNLRHVAGVLALSLLLQPFMASPAQAAATAVTATAEIAERAFVSQKIAIGPDGKVYVSIVGTTSADHRIEVYTSQALFAGQAPMQTISVSDAVAPGDLAVGPSGQLAVLQKASPVYPPPPQGFTLIDGSDRQTWVAGENDGRMSAATFDAGGNLYVAGNGFTRVFAAGQSLPSSPVRQIYYDDPDLSLLKAMSDGGLVEIARRLSIYRTGLSGPNLPYVPYRVTIKADVMEIGNDGQLYVASGHQIGIANSYLSAASTNRLVSLTNKIVTDGVAYSDMAVNPADNSLIVVQPVMTETDQTSTRFIRLTQAQLGAEAVPAVSPDASVQLTYHVLGSNSVVANPSNEIGFPAPAMSWQWQQSLTSSGTFTDIPGATTPIYPMTPWRHGVYVKAKLTLTNTAGTTSVYSNVLPVWAKIDGPTSCSLVASRNDGGLVAYCDNNGTPVLRQVTRNELATGSTPATPDITMNLASFGITATNLSLTDMVWAPDGSIYFGTDGNQILKMTVGTEPSITAWQGPAGSTFQGSSRLAMDASGNLYVRRTTDTGSSVDVFASGSIGTTAAARVLGPLTGADILDLAVGGNGEVGVLTWPIVSNPSVGRTGPEWTRTTTFFQAGADGAISTSALRTHVLDFPGTNFFEMDHLGRTLYESQGNGVLRLFAPSVTTGAQPITVMAGDASHFSFNTFDKAWILSRPDYGVRTLYTQDSTLPPLGEEPEELRLRSLITADNPNGVVEAKSESVTSNVALVQPLLPLGPTVLSALIPSRVATCTAPEFSDNVERMTFVIKHDQRELETRTLSRAPWVHQFVVPSNAARTSVFTCSVKAEAVHATSTIDAQRSLERVIQRSTKITLAPTTLALPKSAQQVIQTLAASMYPTRITCTASSRTKNASKLLTLRAKTACQTITKLNPQVDVVIGKSAIRADRVVVTVQGYAR